jgi:hypothetical protein
MRTVLSTAYWPNLWYFYYLLNSDEVLIDVHETYQKQSYRNRTQILSANGVLNLIIPVVHQHDKMPVHAVEIDYREKWQIKHWRAIESAYNNSPFFNFFEDELYDFYTRKEQYLCAYHQKQLDFIYKVLRKRCNYIYNSCYNANQPWYLDARQMIHPKKDFLQDIEASQILNKPYYQTFAEKFAFTANLSILDLIFNEGKFAGNYLIAS